MVQPYVLIGDVEVPGVRRELTEECLATIVCAVMWIVVTDVLTAVCGADVRCEGCVAVLGGRMC